MTCYNLTKICYLYFFPSLETHTKLCSRQWHTVGETQRLTSNHTQNEYPGVSKNTPNYEGSVAVKHFKKGP